MTIALVQLRDAVATSKNPFADQLRQLRAQLAKLEQAGVGKLIIVPRVTVSIPTPASFGSIDYLAWPYPQYTAWFQAWAGAAQQVGAFGVPWPLGDGMKASSLIDDANASPDDTYRPAAVLQQLGLLPTITTARKALERGLAIFDPIGSGAEGGTSSWLLYVLVGLLSAGASFGISQIWSRRYTARSAV